MADKSFDAVVIGGGHHGTIIAPYLAKAGLSVGVFERLDHLGGGAVSEDGPAPGFRMNFCAHFTRFFGHPAYKEFNLRDEGLEYVFPDTNEAIVFDDDTSYLGYAAWRVVDPKTGRVEFSEKNVQKTYEQIRRFSKNDAETYLRLTELYKEKWRPAFKKYRYSSPTPWGTPDALEALFSDPSSGLDPSMQFMNCKQFARYFFESPELRILMLRGFLTSGGIFPDDIPGLGLMIATIHLALGWESAAIAKGGTQSITDALVSAGKKLGVEYFINSEIKGIKIENGKAKGVVLADGTEIEARKMVVGDVGTPQLFARLVGEEHTNPEMKRRLDTNLYDRGHVWWGTIGVHELPQYKAAKDNPDLNATPRTYWAPKDLAYMENKYMHEIFLLGMSSKLFCLSAPDSIWDPTRAPEGKHSVLFEEYTCPTPFFSRREWRQLGNEFMEELMQQWRKYAPNMKKDNIVASRIITPVDVQETHLDMRDGSWSEGSMSGSQNGRFRGMPGGFRTFIDNLYMCSSSIVGGGGIGRGSSYNCYKVIAEDYGLREPE
ncbi:phytoene desaturase family protein [Desulfatiglans anilini]|uniref:phytoene desaturase family protein n=1 Tax=Desulfatiglans anilini TaxID=90728 RepID=UPI0004154FF3|nr:NAD(P)/FAD-dependent oxidoreductase [Desulfatiglans anilini]